MSVITYTDTQLTRACFICSAKSDEPCTVISGGNEEGVGENLKPGDPRPVPHFYR